ncbi:MAG: hypothetical protein IJR13_04500 [Bacteroidales bacterium]|nr:hypothetical protein [Bacteroidales bacterium]MBQ7279969.1 hypothetical protein [Bacteroidales bacterium]
MRQTLRIAALLTLTACALECMAQAPQRRKPAYDTPMPQSSHFPVEAFVEGARLPKILRPIETTPAGKTPHVALGLSLQELRQQLPLIRLAKGNDERITYTADDTVFYDLYNNRVVLIHGIVKGGWQYPFEEWFVRMAKTVEATAFSRANGLNGFWQYIYNDWVFTIRYNPNNDIYSFRYEYMPSHERFGELKKQ